MSRKAEEETIPTPGGGLRVVFLGHASLMFSWKGTTIHVDPVSAEADYATLPKADLVLVTHGHFDHLDPAAVAAAALPGADLIGNAECRGKIPRVRVLKNGETAAVRGIGLEAVPAYNITGLRAEGVPFHPPGTGNGYVLAFDDFRVYIAGDTENTPEMKALKGIDVAFLPLMRPYTMSPEMVADAARAIRPKILYPYHTRERDAGPLSRLLADVPEIDIRFRYGGRAG